MAKFKELKEKDANELHSTTKSSATLDQVRSPVPFSRPPAYVAQERTSLLKELERMPPEIKYRAAHPLSFARSLPPPQG